MNKAWLLAVILMVTSCTGFTSSTYMNIEPAQVSVESLPAVNSESMDYAPSMTSNGRLLIFVSNRDGSVKTPAGTANSHDLWVSSVNSDGSFSAPQPADKYFDNTSTNPLNTELNEGPCSISSDSRELYFTACGRHNGLGDCDIFVARLTDNRITEVANAGKKINSQFYDAQPSISADGRTLFFVSNRPLKLTKNTDLRNLTQRIWYSQWDDKKNDWGDPVMLNQNSYTGEETAPYIAPDGVTLFFSSTEYMPNYGGRDIYVTRFDQAARSWSSPENLGKPVNTSGNDMFVIVTSGGNVIYYSSETGSVNLKGNIDLFRATMPVSLIKQ